MSHTYSSAGDYTVTLTVNDGQTTTDTSRVVTVTDPFTGEAGKLACEYVIVNEGNTGFVANIRLTNRGTQPVDGWEVSWAYSDGSAMSNSWNAAIGGSNPYTASQLQWNSVVNPNSTVEFGFQGTKGSSNAERPAVTGDVCE